jgi:hypothetical protein
LLTGYQDEESPGRRLQEMAQRGSGTLRLGKDKVDVQCKLATYSLSAHADTGQLVSFVETLDPAQVFLVHGDEAARTSLGEALRARGRRVRLPRAGQSFGFQFTPVVRPENCAGHRRRAAARPAPAVGDAGAHRAGTGRRRRPVCVGDAGRDLVGRSARPDCAPACRAGGALAADPCYFAADPTHPAAYRLRSRGQVELTLRRRSQMAAHGDLTGRWLLARNAEGEAVVGRAVVAGAEWVRLEIGRLRRLGD